MNFSSTLKMIEKLIKIKRNKTQLERFIEQLKITKRDLTILDIGKLIIAGQKLIIRLKKLIKISIL